MKLTQEEIQLLIVSLKERIKHFSMDDDTAKYFVIAQDLIERLELEDRYIDSLES